MVCLVGSNNVLSLTTVFSYTPSTLFWLEAVLLLGIDQDKDSLVSQCDRPTLALCLCLSPPGPLSASPHWASPARSWALMGLPFMQQLPES